MLRRSLCVLSSIALLTSCATGGTDGDDGVIVRADARADDGTEPEETSSPDEDTGTPIDTGSALDTGTVGEDSAIEDTGTPSEDTGTPDTDPPSCPTEETEPNDTPSTARAFGGIDDCDGSGKVVTGVLSTSSDLDLLSYDGSDTFGCSVNPTATVTGPATVCIRAACKSGTTEIKSCPKGTRTGTECCGKTAEIEINCTGTTSDDAKITMTVKGDGSSFTCAAYSVSFHY